ncbi:hypothetical protein Bca4012_020162 [Brassica carinata]|uniref:Zinc knuckle CX2CX4HX4C domain-containing protein n=1 Tax=Brassica carinata TaxID=52824 RepID=A0A8X7WJ32_BRACI|nr:hypothetical protein Bca52824_001422 [Brassica carinata]
MLVLQRWTPLIDMEMLNFIPFWIQIRVYRSNTYRQVNVHVARVLGECIQMDYNEEVGNRLEFVRMNWNVNNSLCFQRNFQFSPDINSLLQFQYERLRGFCKTCGMLMIPDLSVPNQGVIIEEVNEEDNEEDEAAGNAVEGRNVEAEAEPVDPEQEKYERNIQIMEEEADDEQLWNGDGMHTMYSSDVNREEMYNPLYPNGQSFPMDDADDPGLNGKAWLASANGNTVKLCLREKGKTSGTSQVKRKRGSETEQCEQRNEDVDTINDPNKVRGTVGSEQPLAPCGQPAGTVEAWAQTQRLDT